MDLRQCSHTHTMIKNSWTLLHLAFYSELSRRSCARVSRTCVLSVCQNRWTLDPLSAFRAKQMTCLLLSQPSFRLNIFRHFRASSHLLAALPLRQKRFKTVSVGMYSYFSSGTSIFGISNLSEPKPTRGKGNGRATTSLFSCVFKF